MNYKEKIHFEIIVVGTGLSGIMLVWEILKNEQIKHTEILLIDKHQQEEAPRTWCFWDREQSSFDKIITKSWRQAEMFAGSSRIQIDMYPYQYKMMRSEHFFDYTLPLIQAQPTIQFRQAAVQDLVDDGKKVTVITDNGTYTANMVFDSRFPKETLENYNGTVLYQQFTGRFVNTEAPVFDEHHLRLMDFRMLQDQKVAFCYLLPLSPKEALIEYTIFTDTLQSVEALEKGIEAYIARHYPDSPMHISSKEYGVIPMANFPAEKRSERIIPIGTAGGCTKASSGYTFSFVQQHTLHIIASLVANKIPEAYTSFIPRRFSFYDKVLLRVLKKHPEKGNEILFRLFKRNKTEAVISFLHNRSTIREELSIFTKLPVLLFLKAAITEWRNNEKNARSMKQKEKYDLSV